jgi:spore germination cell wall hydrolase CwlJ-like protein
MYNSQIMTTNVVTSIKIIATVLALILGWQHYSSAQASITTSSMIDTALVQSQPQLVQMSPEKIKEQQIKENYEKAKFLSVVETSDQINYSKKDLFCMAKNIYHEAGHEPKLGKYAVAQVTINRMESPLFGDRVCEVVFEPRQFSWANYHGRRWTTPSGPAWNEAKRIAYEVLENNKRIKGMDDALFYHATYVRPSWARTKDRLTRIGLHIFYEQV